MSDNSGKRNDARQDEDQTWTVYDIFTGQAVLLDGKLAMLLEMEEAADLMDLLNKRYIARRGAFPH
jgi:hypothetical protein